MDSVWLKRVLLMVVILLAVGCIAALLLPDKQNAPPTQSETQPPAQQEAQTQPPQTQAEMQQNSQQSETKPMYEMGIWEGNVAVFLPGTDHPMRITEMPVTSLPAADQEALKNRIPVYDAQELASFLEDYGS